MITNNPPKWEYKIVSMHIDSEPTSVVQLGDALNKAGQENWEVVSVILPSLVVMKRQLQAPKVVSKLRFGLTKPVVPVAKAVAPAPVKPLVAALSPTAGKTDGKA